MNANLRQSGGEKFDDGKPQLDLLDPYALTVLTKVLMFGAKKYAPDNWRKGISYRRLVAAAMRHMLSFMDGEDCDPETGLPHAGHAMCCRMFLIWTMKNRADLDDGRFGGELKTEGNSDGK
jgi:hypothetical protein